MSIDKKYTITKTCDLCGKQEGDHLKSKDFYKEPPSLIMINHKGKQVKITLDVKIEEYDKDGVTNTLEDILNNYQGIHQELNYDAVEDPNTQKLDDISSMMPPKIARLLQDIYMKELDYANRSNNQGVLCKTCYTAMVKMVSKLGKFDKKEVF